MDTKTILMTLMTFIIIILTGSVALNQTQNQFFEFCADKEWKGTHEITGDFSGEIDCKETWEVYINLEEKRGVKGWK